MVELSTRKREIRGDGGNHHEKLALRELRVEVNWPSPIRQVPVPIRRVITPIRGLLNRFRQVVLLISHSLSYAPYRSHLHPPSLPLSSTTLPSSQEHKVKSSLSISPCHHHELTLSAAYTEYSIHLRLSVVPSFSRFRVDPWMYLQLPACLPTWSTAISQLATCHHNELTLNAAYAECSIHLRSSVVPSLSRFRVDPWM